jgi:hypothetical protein
LSVVNLREDLAGGGADSGSLAVTGEALVDLHDMTFLINPGDPLRGRDHDLRRRQPSVSRAAPSGLIRSSPQRIGGCEPMITGAPSPMLLWTKGDPVRDGRSESAMDITGLGLLPGLALALGLVVGAMALLLIGSMWAVFAVLALVVIVTAAILAVVVALLDEDGDLGRRLRRAIPGLDDDTTA